MKFQNQCQRVFEEKEAFSLDFLSCLLYQLFLCDSLLQKDVSFFLWPNFLKINCGNFSRAFYYDPSLHYNNTQCIVDKELLRTFLPLLLLLLPPTQSHNYIRIISNVKWNIPPYFVYRLGHKKAMGNGWNIVKILLIYEMKICCWLTNLQCSYDVHYASVTFSAIKMWLP